MELKSTKADMQIRLTFDDDSALCLVVSTPLGCIVLEPRWHLSDAWRTRLAMLDPLFERMLKTFHGRRGSEATFIAVASQVDAMLRKFVPALEQRRTVVERVFQTTEQLEAEANARAVAFVDTYCVGRMPSPDKGPTPPGAEPK
jgi:hypothetical protein